MRNVQRVFGSATSGVVTLVAMVLILKALLPTIVDSGLDIIRTSTTETTLTLGLILLITSVIALKRMTRR